MKKIKVLFVIGLLAVGMGGCASPAQEENKPTTCTYTEKITKEPTCTEEGIKTFICKEDGSKSYTETIAPLGHNYDYAHANFVWGEDESCIAHVICLRCEHEKEIETTIDVEVITEATCKQEGDRVLTASFVVDGVTYKDEKHVTGKLPHNMILSTELSTPASYVTKGENVYVCSVCGEVLKTEEISAQREEAEIVYGTEEKPFLIANLADWEAFATDACTNGFDGQHIKMITNIGTEENPIETFINNTTKSVFSGHIDGNNHELWVDLPARTNGDNHGRSGLITFTSGACIENLVLKGNISGSEYAIAGGIVADFYGKTDISNVKIYANVSGKDTAAGIVGYIRPESVGSTIIDCENYGNIASSSNIAGGIVGKNEGKETLIDGCVNKGDIRVSTKTIGGIIGCSIKNTITIKDCVNEGHILGATTQYIGGILGIASGDVTSCTIEHCVNKADITSDAGGVGGSANIGGIAGSARKTTISNCYNYGSITVTTSVKRVGGIIGDFGGTMSNCYNGYSPEEIEQGKTQGTIQVVGDYSGGIMGANDAMSTITNVVNYMNVVNESTGSVGGIAGLMNTSSTLTNCVNHGNITGTYNVGGLIGRVAGSKTLTLVNCVNSGTIKVNENFAVDDIGGTNNPEENPGNLVGSNGGTVTL